MSLGLPRGLEWSYERARGVLLGYVVAKARACRHGRVAQQQRGAELTWSKGLRASSLPERERDEPATPAKLIQGGSNEGGDVDHDVEGRFVRARCGAPRDYERDWAASHASFAAGVA